MSVRPVQNLQRGCRKLGVVVQNASALTRLRVALDRHVKLQLEKHEEGASRSAGSFSTRSARTRKRRRRPHGRERARNRVVRAAEISRPTAERNRSAEEVEAPNHGRVARAFARSGVRRGELVRASSLRSRLVEEAEERSPPPRPPARRRDLCRRRSLAGSADTRTTQVVKRHGHKAHRATSCA